MLQHLHSIRFVALVSVFSLLLAACGGGGSSSGDSNNVGRVAVLLTDGPIAGVTKVDVTVTSVELLGNGSPISLFNGNRTIDLLDLQSFSNLFAVSDTVPAGNYDKIRLRVSQVEITEDDGSKHIADLPANGKIDLNPRGSFTVVGGATLMVELDIDVGKAIHIVNTGSKRYKFRPVVFVKVLTAVDDGKLVRISGAVRNAVDNGVFVLCTTVNPDTGCVDVEINDETSIFDENADPVAADRIVEGEQLTVIGHLKHDDQNTRLKLLAAVVQLGSPGTFAMLDGSVSSAPANATDAFDFAIDSGQGFADGSSVSVLLQSDTRIFSIDGGVLDFTYLQINTAATVDGILSLSNSDPDTLKSTLIVVNDRTAITMLSGSINTIGAGQFNIATDSGDRCVNLAPGANIILIQATGNEVITAADLAVGQNVEVYGVQGSQCFEATTVLVIQ